MKQKEYIILRRNTIEGLEEGVTEYLNDGWRTSGSFQILVNPDVKLATAPHKVQYLQALEK